MSPARLASIHRYPIKGFASQALARADLRPGQGIPFDRCLAIANGQRPVAPGEAWTPCQAFVRLTRNPDLPSYGLRFHEAGGEAQLLGSDGRSVTLALDGRAPQDGAEDVLAAWFSQGPLGAPHIITRSAEGQLGYWDHEDATVSVINLATVALLKRAADRLVDPLRFRANLYLDGMPALDELALVGRRLRVGDAVLEVLRPINRCRATSVDPASGDASLNVPALLGRSLGHVFCGVYARVVQAGRIEPGDMVEDAGPAPTAARDGAAATTAPPVADWPRMADVVERIPESDSVVSFWLDDSLAALRPPAKAGQHLRVHLVGDDGRAAWRAYTISGVEGSRLRLSVKRDGALSRWLHDALLLGGRVLVSGPHGDVHLQAGPDQARPLALLSAGIGITPTVAMLRELVASGSRRPTTVRHVARDEADLALWAEARDLAGRLPGATAQLHLSRGGAGACAAAGATPGRMTFDPAWVDALRSQDADVYLCGPTGFLADARNALALGSVQPERVHVEVFASPAGRALSPDGGSGAPDLAAGPFRVRYGASGVEATWTREAGTLLDLAEAAGLAPPANCRSGACGSCKALLVSGSVAHLVEPVLPVGPATAYLCCAVPISDVVVG
jgi:hypothetical protein